MKTIHPLCALAFQGLCLLPTLTCPKPAHAAVPALQAPSAGVWQAVSNRKLDTLRGGFDTGRGLMVSFGISRAVYVNGNLVTHTTLNFGPLADLTPARAAQLQSQLLTLRPVQVGPGNSFQPGPSGPAVSTVIQNTLDNQQIVNQTVINASSNAMGMIKTMNLQNTLNEAMARGMH